MSTNRVLQIITAAPGLTVAQINCDQSPPPFAFATGVFFWASRLQAHPFPVSPLSLISMRSRLRTRACP